MRCVNFEEKQTKEMILPAKFIGIAEHSSDEITCYIREESRHPKILTRSNIKYRGINSRKENKSLYNDPQYF